MVYLLRFLLGVAWLFCIGTTLAAAIMPGFRELMPTFVAGFGNPWGAAMNVDFFFYLLFAALWLIWSAKTHARGMIYGLLAFVFGGSFLFAYLLIQSYITRGDLRAMLLGRQRQPEDMR